MNDDNGIWWSVEPHADRVLVRHGKYDERGPLEPEATVWVGVAAAVELAVALVQAALELDPERTQGRALELWLSSASS